MPIPRCRLRHVCLRAHGGRFPAQHHVHCRCLYQIALRGHLIRDSCYHCPHRSARCARTTRTDRLLAFPTRRRPCQCSGAGTSCPFLKRKLLSCPLWVFGPVGTVIGVSFCIASAVVLHVAVLVFKTSEGVFRPTKPWLTLKMRGE